jgi:hypothetical protein
LPDHATAAAAAQPPDHFRKRAGKTDNVKMANQGEVSGFREDSPTSMRRVNSEESAQRDLLAVSQPQSSGLTIRGYNDLVQRSARRRMR